MQLDTGKWVYTMLRNSEWWATVETCEHDWQSTGIRFPVFPTCDTLAKEKVRCTKCSANMERDSYYKVIEILEK